MKSSQRNLLMRFDNARIRNKVLAGSPPSCCR
jgi:hypothetical protein